MAQQRGADQGTSTAILVGFTKYQYLPDLASSASDLRLLARVLGEVNQFDHVETVTDPEGSPPTDGDGDRAFARLRKIVQEANQRKTQRLLLYLSGYAYEDASGNKYLATPAARPNSAFAGIQLSELRWLLGQTVNIETMLVVLDCRKRPDAETESQGLPSVAVMEAFRRGRDAMVIAASSEGQDSHWHSDGEHGLFVHALATALERTADRNRDRSIEAGGVVSRSSCGHGTIVRYPAGRADA